MTEIRWAPATAGVITGYVGTLEAFKVAPSGPGEKWAWHLTSLLPGQQDHHGWAMDPAVVKAMADEWLGKYESARPYVAAALAALRSEIEQERAACYDNAVDLSDEGKDDQRAFGRVEALDVVLATMDRMTATDAATAARQQETTDG